jgi:hypothetical protein
MTVKTEKMTSSNTIKTLDPPLIQRDGMALFVFNKRLKINPKDKANPMDGI